MKIITLTLSPAFDMHCAGEIRIAHENLIHMTAYQAGGKGVNISRALLSNNMKSRALLLLGEENQQEFLRELHKDGLDAAVISVPGRIRENMTIHAPDGTETRISFPGFSAVPGTAEKIEAFLQKETDGNTVITMTGRVPEGISLEQVKGLLCRAKEKGARIVVDSRSFGIRDLLELKPWLIKPNQEEISEYLGRQVHGLEEVIHQAKQLRTSGITNVMVSMGGEGALLVCEEGVFLAKPPVVNVKSTIGAGDSTIAGFLAAAASGCNAEKTLRLAVANGTAACLTEGTMPPESKEIHRIMELIQITAYQT